MEVVLENVLDMYAHVHPLAYAYLCMHINMHHDGHIITRTHTQACTHACSMHGTHGTHGPPARTHISDS